nr:DNA repair protein RadA [Gemmatimonadota bacterium]
GEIRAVGQMDRRLAEAARMGFRRAYVSPKALGSRPPAGISTVETEDVRGLIQQLFP